jgi:hypothetical protein
MDERHFQTEEPLARPLVDESGARAGKLDQGRVEIAHLVGHMVHAWTTPAEEAADRRVLAERLEKLHPPAADLHRGRAYALALDRRSVLDLCPEEALVRSEGVVEIFDGNSQMMDPPCPHQADAIERLADLGGE